MQVSRIDFNLITQIMEAKEIVKSSIEAVMDEKLTASHLVVDVHALMDLLDMMEQAWKGTPPESGPAEAAEAAPAPEAPPATEAQAEQPPAEQVQAEQPPAGNE